MNDSMFQVESKGDVTILSTSTELNARNADEARAFLRDLIASGQTRLVLDLSGMSFLDSSGLSSVLFAMKAVRNAGGELRLCGLSEPVRSIFEITRLLRVIAVHPDRETALAAFR
jgi:anti-sigma B factor antagonist